VGARIPHRSGWLPLGPAGLIAFCLICATVAAQGTSRKNVLILHSYDLSFQWVKNTQAGLDAVLSADDDIVPFIEFMDTKRHVAQDYLERLVELYRSKYGAMALDVVICCDNNALDFTLAHREDLFHGAPAVFCGINDFNEKMIAGHRDVTGVAEVPDFRGTIEMALALHPATRRIVVVSDTLPSGRAHPRQVQEIALEFEDRVSFEYLTNETRADLEQALQRVPRDSAVLFLSFFQDAQGVTFSVQEGAQLVCRNTKAPVYSCWRTMVVGGVLGGRVISGQSQGEAAARLALRILRGEPVQAMPVITESPNEYVVDYPQLVRFGLQVSDLPDDTLLLNKPFSFYEEYRAIILGVIIFTALQTTLIGVLLLNRMMRLRAEAALRASEERYRSFIQNFHGIAYRANFNYVPLFFHGATYALTGYTQEEFTAGNPRWDHVIHPEDLATLPGRYEVTTIPDYTLEREYRIIRKDGGIRWVHDFIQNMCDESGKPNYCQGVIYDITDRKKAEEESARLEEQLRQAQRLESIGRLAGGIAHDFNNLLSPIIGFAEMALEDVPESDPLHADIEEIREAAEHAKNLTQQLLAFSRKQVLEMKVLDLGELVSRSERILRRTVREDIQIQLDIQSPLGSVKADPSQIEQILMNLAVNAQDAMPDGGALSIDIANAVIDETYIASHPDARPGNYVVLSVSDTGHGMTRQTLAHVFEPFFTTRELGQGTGLGLATVHGIVKQHGGHVWVYSEPGVGTTVKVYLPHVEDSPESVPLELGKSAVKNGSETVLIVEDEDAVRKLVGQILRRHGYNAIEAEDAKEALRLAQEHQGAIHLLVTDVIMPGMNGKQLYQQLAAAHPHMRVLYMSGYPDNLIAHHGILDPAVHFLPKPFASGSLAGKVREVLDQ